MTCEHPKPWQPEYERAVLVDADGCKRPGRTEWVFTCPACKVEVTRDADLFVGTDFNCHAPPEDLTTVGDLDLFYLWFAAHTDHPLYIRVVQESQRRGRWRGRLIAKTPENAPSP